MNFSANLQRIVTLASGAAVLATAATSFAQAIPPRPIPPRPNPIPPVRVPTQDRLAYQRADLQTASYRLLNASSAFYRLARQYAQKQIAQYDPIYGRRIVTVVDPIQRAGVLAAGQLSAAASQLATFQAQFNSCGAYERQRGRCNQSLARELALLQNTRNAYQRLQLQLRNLTAARTAAGRSQVTQLRLNLQRLVNLYKLGGVLNPRPVPAPRPLPPLQPRPPVPVPAPQPNPIPAPRPQPVPVPSPVDPGHALNQARPIADQIAAAARNTQQQASRFRRNTNDDQAVQAVDALVTTAETLVAQLKTQNLDEAKYAAQELDIQLNATVAAVELALQRSNDLTQVAQSLNQIQAPANQLLAILGIANQAPPQDEDGGYNPGDRPPYGENGR